VFLGYQDCYERPNIPEADDLQKNNWAKSIIFQCITLHKPPNRVTGWLEWLLYVRLAAHRFYWVEIESLSCRTVFYESIDMLGNKFGKQQMIQKKLVC